jgi:hypothetical protein
MSMSASVSTATTRTARLVAVLASLSAGVIYLLIGTGIVSVGRSTQDGATDLFAFGALMGAVSVAIAIGVWLLPVSRFVLAGVAIVELIALIGYVAAAGLREPPFDLWGLAIKAFQTIVLYLFTERGRETPSVGDIPGGAA